MTSKDLLIYADQIGKSIYIIRGHRVMLNSSLADLYGVEPRVLIQAVKRNIERVNEINNVPIPYRLDSFLF